MVYNGYMKFIFIANNFSLDLVNTLVNVNGQETDLLLENSDVSAWLDVQGLSLSRAMNTKEFEQLKELREVIKSWVLLRSEIKQSHLSQSLRTLNKYLNQQNATKKLIQNQDGFSYETQDQQLSPQSLLAKVASEFAGILVAGDLEKVKQCSAQQCILVFLDTSKSKRRRWCSMKVCGNRAKASSFYQNHKVHN